MWLEPFLSQDACPCSYVFSLFSDSQTPSYKHQVMGMCNLWIALFWTWSVIQSAEHVKIAVIQTREWRHKGSGSEIKGGEDIYGEHAQVLMTLPNVGSRERRILVWLSNVFLGQLDKWLCHLLRKIQNAGEKGLEIYLLLYMTFLRPQPIFWLWNQTNMPQFFLYLKKISLINACPSEYIPLKLFLFHPLLDSSGCPSTSHT